MLMRFFVCFVFLGVTLMVGAAEATTPAPVSQALGLGWDAAKALGEVIGKGLSGMIIWSLVGFVVGGVGGFFAWRTLRDRGWLDVSWGWYKYVRWMWPVLMTLTLALGLSSMLGSWGASRAVKQGMRQGEVIETAVFNTYAMVMVWRVDPKQGDVNGSGLLEQDLASAVAKLRDADGQAQELEKESHEQLLAKMEEQAGGGLVRKWFFGKMLDLVFDQVKEDLSGQDAVEFLSATLEVDRTGGETQAVQFVRKKIMAAVFLAVDETVNAVVYPFILSVILLILGVLGLPLGLFWLARWWWLKKNPETPPDSEDPPELDSVSMASE
jgi:hypothetical protein